MSAEGLAEPFRKQCEGLRLPSGVECPPTLRSVLAHWITRDAEVGQAVAKYNTALDGMLEQYEKAMRSVLVDLLYSAAPVIAADTFSVAVDALLNTIKDQLEGILEDQQSKSIEQVTKAVEGLSTFVKQQTTETMGIVAPIRRSPEPL